MRSQFGGVAVAEEEEEWTFGVMVGQEQECAFVRVTSVICFSGLPPSTARGLV